MRRVAGQSLSEYVLIGALVTVVAIPALMLLGLGVDEKLTSSSTRLSGNPMDYFNQKNGQENSGGGERTTATPVEGKNGSAAASEFDPGPMKGNGWEAKYDPINGQIIYSMPASGGGGTNTASVTGLTSKQAQMTQEMASQIYAIANMSDRNGNPLPAGLANLIRKLAGYGHDMALQQEELAPWYNDPAIAGNGLITITDLEAKDKAFIALYNVLEGYFKDPKYADIATQVAAYSGVISYVSWDNLSHWDNYEVVPRDSVGTPPELVAELDGSADITEKHADKIDDIADKTGNSGPSFDPGGSTQ